MGNIINNDMQTVIYKTTVTELFFIFFSRFEFPVCRISKGSLRTKDETLQFSSSYREIALRSGLLQLIKKTTHQHI